MLTVWLVRTYADGRLGLPAVTPEDSDLPTWQYWAVHAVYFLPGVLAGGLLGWFVIRPVNCRAGLALPRFNRGFDGMTAGYGWTVGMSLRRQRLVLLVYGGLLVLTYLAFQGGAHRLHPAAGPGPADRQHPVARFRVAERTQEAVDQVERSPTKTEGVAHTGRAIVAALSFLLQANSSNFASMFVVLKPFDERQNPGLRDTAIMAQLRKAWSQAGPGGQGHRLWQRRRSRAWASPAASSSSSRTAAASACRPCSSRPRRWSASCRQQPGLNSVTTQFRSNTPQLFLDIDRAKVASLGVSLNDVNQTLDMYLGSLYVNSFNDFGRHWQVTVQADGPISQPGRGHQPVPGAQQPGPDGPAGHAGRRARDRRPTVDHALQPLHRRGRQRQHPGHQHRRGHQTTSNRIADETLPLSMKAEWTELMFLQIRAGNTALYVFLLSHPLRLPGPGGALRKLVAAAGGHPGGAAVPALLGGRRAATRTATSTSSCRSAWWCWSAWRARTPS